MPSDVGAATADATVKDNPNNNIYYPATMPRSPLISLYTISSPQGSSFATSKSTKIKDEETGTARTATLRRSTRKRKRNAATSDTSETTTGQPVAGTPGAN